MPLNNPTLLDSQPPAVAAAPPSGSQLPSGMFLRKFLRHGFAVAAMRPAGKALAIAHCQHVDPSRPQVIVEIGAGTGAVTKAVAQRMHKDSLLIAVEIDQDFASILRSSCPQVTVLACDACELPAQLAALNVSKIDLMISCIALPYVPRAVNEAIFGCLDRMGPDAWFTQQTLVPLVYRKMYHRLFHEVHFRMVFANLPPGGVYHCRGMRADYSAHLPGKR